MINRYIKIAKINTIKYCELVYPVHNKRGAPVMHPNGTDDRQDQGQTGRNEAQNLVRKAHGLSRGQSRVTHLQNAVAGSKRLLEYT